MNMEYSDMLNAAKLMLEIQAPSLEECWQDGYESSALGSLDDNPFDDKDDKIKMLILMRKN